MPASEHEQWRFDPRSGSILGPNNQLVAVVEDRDKEAIGRVFVRAFRLLKSLEECVATGDPEPEDLTLIAECCGEEKSAAAKRLGISPTWGDREEV